MCLFCAACSQDLMSITEPGDLSISIRETRMHENKDGAYLKHLATTPDPVIPTCAQIWNIITPWTHPDVFYLGLEGAFPHIPEQR